MLRSFWRAVRPLLYGPPNFLVAYFTAEDRRMLAFWVFVLAIALAPFLGKLVFFVTALSVVALGFGFLSETPVEIEDEDAEA